MYNLKQILNYEYNNISDEKNLAIKVEKYFNMVLEFNFQKLCSIATKREKSHTILDKS